MGRSNIEGNAKVNQEAEKALDLTVWYNLRAPGH